MNWTGTGETAVPLLVLPEWKLGTSACQAWKDQPMAKQGRKYCWMMNYCGFFF